jgi:ADP-ribosylglycohydrolase
MTLLNHATLKDKIAGCWEGKNIGGVLGAPFEMYRGLVDISFYTQDLSKNIPANDDLDLQLILLDVIEKYGKAVTADVIAEYWLSYQIANCAEYGTSKQNLTFGIRPPMSGAIANPYKDSNGAFIRSEIWACVNPGNPEQAVRYVYEDAMIDHAHEGVYSSAFCVAFESAAFFESDVEKLVDIGASYVPQDSAVYSVITRVKKMVSEKKTIEEIRAMLLTDFPSTFSLGDKHPGQIDDGFPFGEMGFDAPVQIGIIVASLLLGKGDFEKTIINAVHCGEDADCTAATVGAMLGIVMGRSNLPEKWSAPLGGKIETAYINKTLGGLDIPENVDDLTERVLRLIPVFLDGGKCKLTENGMLVYSEPQQPYSMADLYYRGYYGQEEMKIHELLKLAPYKKLYKNTMFNTLIDYGKEPFIELGETVKLGVTLYNMNMDRVKHCLCVKIITDDGVVLHGSKHRRAMVANNYECKTEMQIEFTVEQSSMPYVDIYLDITAEGRPTNELIKCRYFFK